MLIISYKLIRIVYNWFKFQVNGSELIESNRDMKSNSVDTQKEDQ